MAQKFVVKVLATGRCNPLLGYSFRTRDSEENMSSCLKLEAHDNSK